MAIRIVQSRQNARVKELRAALLRPGRGEGDSIALEGLHLVDEALRSGMPLQTIFVAQGHENLIAGLGLKTGDTTEILAVPREILDSVVSTESPQPIAALAHPRNWPWAEVLGHRPGAPAPIPALLAVLSGIQDPGNLGTILRSAEAFGATGVICLTGTVSRWNPKAMRASAGSVFRLPTLASSAAKCFQHLREANIHTLAALPQDADPLGHIDLRQPIALVIGAEGSGLAPEIAAECDDRITIPCPGPVESLNAAVAASVLLYEASRQRALAPPAPASKTKRLP
jgi:TrmH family RNA methyltransferase